MKVVFRTLNSVYELDHEQGTWARLVHNNDVDPAIPLRDESGVMWAHTEVVVGRSVVIIGPPRDEGFARRVTTSIVTEVIEGETDEWRGVIEHDS